MSEINTFSDSVFIVHPVNVASVSDADHEEYLAFNNRLRAESNPDDPPRTLEDQLTRWRNIPPIITIYTWAVRDSTLPGNPIVGLGELQARQQEANQNMAYVRLSVLPERRREGIARQLLHTIATMAQELGRTLLMIGTTDRVPAGERFMEALGAERGLESRTNQLVLAELDRATLRAYREESERRGDGEFELLRFKSPIPDELLGPATELFNRVSNDVPHGDLSLEPEQMTPEEVRAWEQASMASGAIFLIIIGQDRAGTLAGLTMITWRKHTAYVAEQGITGVLPEYRGRGLARLLKAAMLEQLLDEYPDVQFVRTDNAHTNAGMLAINHALGFRLYRTETVWQVPTERVLLGLAGGRQ